MMKSIGGNTTAVIQTKTTTKNAIGERTSTWTDTQTLTGFLDMMSGDSNRETYNAKVTESTHVFVCDYVQFTNGVNAEDCRLVIGSDKYDITYIDNPMNLNYQLEIFLKYTGGVVNA